MFSWLKGLIGPKATPVADEDPSQKTYNALHALFTAEVGNPDQRPDKRLMPV